MLHDKYLLPKEQADLIASFLGPMLRLHPDKRAKASELVHHAWLEGIIVQGEIDLIRRAEEEELRRKEAARVAGVAAAGAGPEGRAKLAQADERHQMEELTDADAMKPVDDAGSLGDIEQGKPVLVTSTTAAKENAIRTTPTKKTSPSKKQATAKASPGQSTSSKRRG